MKKNYVFLLIGMMFVASGLAAFAGFTAAQEKGPLVIGDPYSVPQLDPQDAYDSGSADVIRQVMEGLYAFNYSSQEMESIPNLALDLGSPSALWGVDNKQVNLTIDLKEDVTFHDGFKFNASAVKWTFDRIQYMTYGLYDFETGDLIGQSLTQMEPYTLFQIQGTPILNTTIIESEYQITFVLNLGLSIWQKLIAGQWTFFMRPDDDYAYGTLFQNTIQLNVDACVGTGPYMLVDYILDDRVIFKAYDGYHEPRVEGYAEDIIYLIVPDDTARSLAILSYEIHYGAVDADFDDQWDLDDNLIEQSRATFVMFYMVLGLNQMPYEARRASQYAWNYSYLLDQVLGGNHIQAKGPVPVGMFGSNNSYNPDPEEIPYTNLTKAREILLDPGSPFAANLTARNLDINNVTADWRAVAESTSPIAWFNWSGYAELGTFWPTLVVEDMKDIGFKLDILQDWNWNSWLEDVLYNPAVWGDLCYSFGGWGPDYADPITMVEPLYYTNASSNNAEVNDPVLNAMIDDTYDTSGAEREALFWDIADQVMTVNAPQFNMFQQAGTIAFNAFFIDPDSTTELRNPFRDWIWKWVVFNAPIIEPEKIIPGYGLLTLVGVALVVTAVLVVSVKKRK
jgi:ABC-type transport system substrate-binding protein